MNHQDWNQLLSVIHHGKVRKGEWKNVNTERLEKTPFLRRMCLVCIHLRKKNTTISLFSYFFFSPGRSPPPANMADN